MKRRNFPGRIRQRREGARIRLFARLAGTSRYWQLDPLPADALIRITTEIATLDARIGGAT